MGDRYVDRDYEARRPDAFFVAVNCGQSSGTCFCVSMDNGPKAESGFDLALTELLDAPGHRFIVEVGSDAGRVLRRSPHRAPPRPTSAAADSPWHAATHAGPHARHRRHQGPPLRQPRAPALGGGRRPLPVRAATARWCARRASAARPRTRPTWPAGDRARARVGFVLLARPLLHPRRQRPGLGTEPLPAVDDAQAGELDRPVRNLGLRRLRALHHLVPGGDRHHRGGGGDPRTDARRCEDDRCLPRTPRLAGLAPEHRELIAGCARNRAFADRRIPAARGRSGRLFYVCVPARSRSSASRRSAAR